MKLVKVKNLDDYWFNQVLNLSIDSFNKEGFNKQILVNLNKTDGFNFFLYIDTKNQKLIGYLAFLEANDFIDIYEIAISNNYKNQGIGSLLIKELKTLKKQISLEVSTRYKTNLFYEKNGFLNVGIRKNYYLDNSDALIYVLNVEK